jgi:gliding motility-associated-like protein
LIEPTSCFCAIHAPTGFTPNFDGLNDEFQLFYECQVVNGNFRIYNRWGDEVFASSDPGAVWDGTFMGQSCPEGVYVWVMDFEYQVADRINYWVRRGTVTLVR